MNKPEAKGHSEEYFGDCRDYWYNQDFLELMAKRWELENVRVLLDVGCGQCHWTRIVSQFLGAGANVTAVDADPKWAKNDGKLHEFFAAREIGFEIEQADVLDLPFADSSFDAVTCQTVLIHIENPLDALREMKRVLIFAGLIYHLRKEPSRFGAFLKLTQMAKCFRLICCLLRRTSKMFGKCAKRLIF